MIPKFNIGDIVSNHGIKGSVSAIELDSMITANVQPYYVVKMEYGKEILPESSLEYSGFFNVIKSKIVALFS
jgi:ribosomal 30S subunit maturation factor RimM